MKISVVIPALDEEDVIKSTIEDLPVEELGDRGFDVEVIVVDNNSTDKTAEAARKAGVKVVHEEKRGYGNAYLRGFRESTGDIIVMGDADGTYPLRDMPEFIEEITGGNADLVIGSRLRGRIHEEAMPWLHRYVGNPLLTGVLNLLFGTGISDAHCGMRAFSRGALERMDLKTPGMEFASEMVIEASRKKLKIKEIPVDYYPRRGGRVKLNSFQDGWRHVRFMLLYKPVPFFLLPGLVLFLLGLFILGYLLSQGTVYRFHSLILAGFLSVIGFQLLSTGLYFKVYGLIHGVGNPGGYTRKLLNYHSLEVELFFGFVLFVSGLALGSTVVYKWASTGFGGLSEFTTALASLVLASIGLQVILIALFISVLLLNWGSRDE